MKQLHCLLLVFVLFVAVVPQSLQAQVSDKENLPSLIPFPQRFLDKEGYFLLKDCSFIFCESNKLMQQAVDLQSFIIRFNKTVQLVQTQPRQGNYIELKETGFDPSISSDEGYELVVRKNKIQIKGLSAHGVFNALQTFFQLIDKEKVKATEIQDWPAFRWRGFMVDVGWNYQSLSQLKEQVEIMGRYKLNVFHFHLTEDIAWRLESKKYPQLTAPGTMIRNKGQFYSVEEIQELVAFCKKRFITFLPEIDMPGHSAAFTRAMGFDMQTEEGMKVVKDIISEICDELDIPYLHIGGDEITIRNKDFLPEMIQATRAAGKEVVAWNPGGNVLKGTILQMWNGNTVSKSGYPSIDSRHLYLNHFDPFDGVTSVFNHRICDRDAGDSLNWGATLCNWPDRKVNSEKDIIRMNAVYPVMLTFAERTWRGGGIKNYTSSIGNPGDLNYQQFFLYEQRLLVHKARYFKQQPFPYVSQKKYQWTFLGPYDNKGMTETVFPPETGNYADTVSLEQHPKLYGATIWLRHFWHPLISSHLSDPKDSTTWYAVMKVNMEKAGFQDCWIGFNNISRSPATDSPPVGAWDDKNSAVWVNGSRIDPPEWKRGGQKGNAETPLEDEGYEYRSPTRIFFKKGMNTVLLKCPVGSTKGKDWQNPVKWMFTFVLLPLH